MKKCYFCRRNISELAEHYIVRKAIKPPKTPHRWRDFAVACIDCGSAQKTSIDPWKDIS